MRKNDWLPGFVIGLVLIVAEVGYLAHLTGLTSEVSNLLQPKTIIDVAVK